MKEKILKRIERSDRTAEHVADKLLKIDDRLKPILDKWIETGSEDDDTMIEGYSVNTLIRDKKLKFTGALLTLDGLIKDPETTKKAMAYGFK